MADRIESPEPIPLRGVAPAPRLPRPWGSGEVALLDRERALRELDRWAWWLDSSVRIPGIGLRVGLDSLVGLVPVAGDLVGAAMSAYLIRRAMRFGVPRRTLARMIGNVALETAMGTVPLLGDAFDAVFRANQRNVRLLREAVRRKQTTRSTP